MRAPCPHCGSPATVSEGIGTVRIPVLVDGRAGRREATVTRVRCRDCGRKGTAYASGDILGRAALRDRLAELTFALGQAGAAHAAGIPETTLQRHLRAWGAAREGDPADAAPASLLLEPATLRNARAVLVADAERETLVEILGDAGDLAGWISRPGRPPPVRVAVPPDPALAALIVRLLPGATLVVVPDALARAVSAAARRSLAAIRRLSGMSGRNAMPTDAEFLAAIAADGCGHPGWPPEVAALARAARVAMEACRSRSASSLDALWPEFALLAGERGAGSVLRLMATWREPLRIGLDDRALPFAAAGIHAIGIALAARRPALGFADLRAYALLRGFVRDAAGLSGVPLDNLLSDLAA